MQPALSAAINAEAGLVTCGPMQAPKFRGKIGGYAPMKGIQVMPEIHGGWILCRWMIKLKNLRAGTLCPRRG